MIWPRRLMPSLQELAAFEAAARHGSFSRAAAELSLTQGAVSKQVRQLEETLGVALFERENRRVVLTAAGQGFQAPARALLEGLAAATHSVMATAGAEGVLNIAVLPTFAARWLIPRLPRFQAAHPGLALNLRTRLEPFDLEEAGIDLAIHYGAPHWPGAECLHLLEEEIVPVASPACRARLGLRAPEDLARATLLQLATRPRLWSEWCERQGIALPNALRGPLFDQFSFTAGAAIAGMGVALVPRFLVGDELAGGALEVPFGRPMPGPGAYYAVVPVSRRRHPAVALLTAWLRAEAGAA